MTHLTRPNNPETPIAGKAEEKEGGDRWHKVRRWHIQDGDAIAGLISSVFTSCLTGARYQFMRWYLNAPHKLKATGLVAGFHEMDLERNVINQEGDTYDFYAPTLAAVVTAQIFSYIHGLGRPLGCIRTGEAIVFLRIPTDPTVLQYHLCIPNQDVQTGDERRLHRTAVGQMLAFTLQALAAEAPSQGWHDAAYKTLSTWGVEYLNVLHDIPVFGQVSYSRVSWSSEIICAYVISGAEHRLYREGCEIT